jgi:DNA-binding NarL/FixJ family response regulator
VTVSLTPRQVQVLALICAGKPSRVIAEEIGVTDRNVKEHTRNLRRIAGVSRRWELVGWAEQLDLQTALTRVNGDLSKTNPEKIEVESVR